MYRKKSLRIFKQKIIENNKTSLINGQRFIFYFAMIYITYSDYLSLKSFSKMLNCLFLKKNDLFCLVGQKLNLLIFKNLINLILVNDQINYLSNSNKKNYKLELFPVKLKFLYCQFENYILTREYLFSFFQFMKNYEMLLDQKILFILIFKFFINIYKYFYKSICCSA